MLGSEESERGLLTLRGDFPSRLKCETVGSAAEAASSRDTASHKRADADVVGSGGDGGVVLTATDTPTGATGV